MAFDDLFVYPHRILIPEWWLSNDEFIYEDPQRPPVHSKTVAAVMDDLRCKIFRCPAKSVSLTVPDLFGKTKIDEFYMSFRVEKDVFRFKITIGNALNIMEKLECQGYFCGIKSRCRFTESSCTSKKTKYFAPWAIIKLYHSQQ